jgi:hypothetical protein
VVAAGHVDVEQGTAPSGPFLLFPRCDCSSRELHLARSPAQYRDASIRQMHTILVACSGSRHHLENVMRMVQALAQTLFVAGMFVAASAHAGSKDILPLQHGTYVREGYDAEDPPFAAILEFDGSTFSDPHSSACVSEVLDHDGAKYRVRTTCFAAGDGTPAAPYSQKERVVVQSPTRMQFTHDDDTAVYRLVKAS